MIDRVRTFIGYREYPKYGIVSRYFVYKQALWKRLVLAHVLHEQEGIFYLTSQELHEVARTNQVDGQLIRRRKDAFRSYQALTPPRVLTSDGEDIVEILPKPGQSRTGTRRSLIRFWLRKSWGRHSRWHIGPSGGASRLRRAGLPARRSVR